MNKTRVLYKSAIVIIVTAGSFCWPQIINAAQLSVPEGHDFTTVSDNAKYAPGRVCNLFARAESFNKSPPALVAKNNSQKKVNVLNIRLQLDGMSDAVNLADIAAIMREVISCQYQSFLPFHPLPAQIEYLSPPQTEYQKVLQYQAQRQHPPIAFHQ